MPFRPTGFCIFIVVWGVCGAFIRRNSYTPITFNYAPTPQEFSAHEDAQVECHVSGSPQPEISWRFKHMRIVDDDKYTINANSMTIHDVQSDDSGEYECRAEMVDHGAFSLTRIEVVVKSTFEPITFDYAPTPQQFELHEDAQIECHVSGSPKPEISWRFGGRRLTSDDKYTPTPGGLVIHDMQTADAGSYQCRAEVASYGIMESMEIDVRVNNILDYKVNIQPSFPVNIVALGIPLVRKCSVSSGNGLSTEPKIIWTNPIGETIHSKTGRVYVEEDGNSVSLFITDIKSEDIGLWTCDVTVGNRGMGKNVNLIVFQDIKFANAPSPQYFEKNSNALIKCDVIGVPMPQISWRFDHKTIMPSNKYAIEKSGLRIHGITVSDAGTYQCRAEVPQNGRLDYREIEVIVLEKPCNTKRGENCNA